MAHSVFYYHLKRLKAADRYANEKESIKLIFHEHKGRYCYRRVTAEMHNRGFMLNHKTIQKLMGDLGLKAKYAGCATGHTKVRLARLPQT